MATFRGRDGVVEVGANKVLMLQSWSYTETAATVEIDSMGDEWMNRYSDIKDASGEIVFFDDDTAASNGQSGVVLGSVVALKLYGRGEGSGKVYRTGSAIITEVSAPVSKGEVPTVTASWVSNGAWTTATVSA